MPFPPTRRKVVPHPYAAISEPGSTRPSPELQLRWKCLQAGRRPPASCPRISLRLPLTQPRAPAEALVQRHKSFQEAWLPWVERTCRAACCGLAGARRPRGASCRVFLPPPRLPPPPASCSSPRAQKPILSTEEAPALKRGTFSPTFLSYLKNNFLLMPLFSP